MIDKLRKENKTFRQKNVRYLEKAIGLGFEHKNGN